MAWWGGGGGRGVLLRGVGAPGWQVAEKARGQGRPAVQSRALGDRQWAGGGQQARVDPAAGPPGAGPRLQAPAAPTPNTPPPPPPPAQQFAVTAAKKDGALDMGLKSTYTAATHTVVSTINQSGKVRLRGAAACCRAGCPAPQLPLPPALADASTAAALWCWAEAEARRAHCAVRPPLRCVLRRAQLGVAATYKELVPGLTLGLSTTLPDIDSSKVGRPAVPACLPGRAPRPSFRLPQELS